MLEIRNLDAYLNCQIAFADAHKSRGNRRNATNAFGAACDAIEILSAQASTKEDMVAIVKAATKIVFGIRTILLAD